MTERAKKKQNLIKAGLAVVVFLVIVGCMTNIIRRAAIAEAGATGADQSTSETLTAAQEYIPQEKALSIAEQTVKDRSLIEEKIQIAKISSALALSLEGEMRWYVNYHSLQTPSPYLLITIDPVNAQVLETSYQNFKWYQDLWRAAKGQTWEWSLEDQVAFNQIYMDDERGPRLPQPEHIVQEEAKRIAISALMEKYALSEQQLAPYRIGYSFQDGAILDRLDACVWLIGFYSQKKNTVYPDYQVNIEAETGEVVFIRAADKGGN